MKASEGNPVLRGKRRLCGTVLIALAVAAIAAGCGGGDDRTTGGSDPTGTTTGSSETVKFSGEPLTVYYMAPIETPLADYSDAAAAVRAAADAVNAEGGIDGHELAVEVCSDSDANAEVECVRKAADAEALAFIGSSFIFNPVAGQEILEQHQIPSIASQVSNRSEFGNPINFPIYVPPLGLLACPQQLSEVTGAGSIAAIAQDLPVQKELLEIIAGAATVTDVSYAGEVTVPTTQTDYSSAARSLADTGAKGVVDVLAPSAQVPFFTSVEAIGASFDGFCSGPSLYTNETLEQLGDQADSIYISTGLPPTSPEAAAKSPLIEEFRDQMEAAAAAGDGDAALDNLILPSNALNAWLGVKILEQVAPQVKGELTSKSLLAALDKAQINLGNVVPPLDFAKPVPAKGFERVFNPVMKLYRWNSKTGDFVDTRAKPVNVLEVLAALAESAGG